MSQYVKEDTITTNKDIKGASNGKIIPSGTVLRVKTKYVKRVLIELNGVYWFIDTCDIVKVAG